MRVQIMCSALTIMLTGCGSVGALKSCNDGSECVSYALVSEGEASGMAATIAGEASSCKVTIFGDVNAWKISYKGKSCEAELNGGGD